MGQGGQEKRGAARRRTRLRSGKVLTRTGAFLANCLMHDVSATGARLKLLANAILPLEIRFIDENGRSVRDAVVVWRRGPQLGIRFSSEAAPLGDVTPSPRPEIIVRVYRPAD
jgi:hypothetical protein